MIKELPSHKRLSLAVFSLNLLIVISLIANYLIDNRRDEAQRSSSRKEATDTAVKLIQGKLKVLANLTSQLADNLTVGDAAGLEERMASIKAGNRDIFGIGAAFEPFAFDPGKRLYAPFVFDKPDRSSQVVHIEDSYDYTANSKQSAWYTTQRDSKVGVWKEPYYGEVAGEVLAEFSVPVIRGGKQIGMTYVNYSREDIEKMGSTLKIGGIGYCLLASKEGKLIFHPDKELVHREVSIREYLKDYGQSAYREIESSLDASASGSIDVTNAKTGQRLSVYHSGVSGSDWTLMIVFIHDAALRESEEHWRRLCWIVVFSVCTLISLAFFTFYREGQDAWDLSVATTVVFACATGVIWHMVHNEPIFRTNGSPIIDPSRLEQFERNHRRSSQREGEAIPAFIPTGLFVQSIEFASANDVVLTGYVWQKYKSALKGEIGEGVIFPEAETTELTEVYRKKIDDHEVIGWYFNVTLRQRFEYNLFPMENNDVWIRIWHKDFERNAMLIPDLGSYEKLVPEYRPGVERDFVLPGWRVVNSYFSFRENSYGTDFGLGDYVGQDQYPELYFNIKIQRKIMSPMIKHFVPLIVVLVTLFLMLCVSDKSLDQAFGFNSMAVIATATGLFFVAIFQHIDLRNSLESSGIIYFEYLYFICYASILLVSVNSIVRVMPAEEKAIEPRIDSRGPIRTVIHGPIEIFRFAVRFVSNGLKTTDGEVLKYIYWPLLACAFWVITLFVYY